MKNSFKGNTLLQFVVTILVAFSSTSLLHAHPYASCVTNDGAGNIKFILNENADSVYVVFEDNTTNTLGNTKGVQSFAFGAHSGYAIYATKIGSGAINQISVDTSNAVNFFGPRGVAVDRNPATHTFGRIYVANASAGTSGGRHVDRGFYVVNPDCSDAIGQGNIGKTAGITFSAASQGTTYSPFKINVGPDSLLYANVDNTNDCTMYRIDPDITTNIAVLNGAGLLIPGTTINASGTPNSVHGRPISKPIIQGSIATSDLVVYDIDTDFSGGNKILQYQINAGPLPWNNAPNVLGDSGLDTFLIICDLDVNGTNFYTSGFRANDGDSYGSVKVFESTGNTVIWNSFAQSPSVGHDPLELVQGMAVSPDGKYMAGIRSDSSSWVISLTNGVPDYGSLVTNVVTASATARAVGWDAADNYYVVSGGNDLLRAYSLGLSTTTIYSNDVTTIHGKFQLVTPATTVSVTASNQAVGFAQTVEASQNFGSPIPATFVITRSSPNPTDLNSPLTVKFAISGTATNGTYNLSPSGTTSIVLAAGQASTNITLTPVSDGLSRPETTAILTLSGGVGYGPAQPTVATITIQNTGPQLLFISGAGAPSAYKGITNDFASFIVTRWGDTNAASYFVSNFTYGGTGVSNIDYLTAQPISVDPGLLTVTGTISPTQAVAFYVGNKTVNVAVAAGGGYTANTASNTTLTIIDNQYPVTPVLFSDDLAISDDATNWGVTFGNANGLDATDFSVSFGYTLAADGIGLPPNGSPTALKVTCNKDGNTSAAGVNLYMTNKVFSGNYAMRFNMNLVQGTSPATATEGVLFGINHNGLETNWWSGSTIGAGVGPWAADGVWYWVDSDPGGATAGDYLEKTGNSLVATNQGWFNIAALFSTSFANNFKSPVPFTAFATGSATTPRSGIPANSLISANPPNTWCDVEIKQINNLVTMTIDKIPIFTFSNVPGASTNAAGNPISGLYTNGMIMLGYDDPFNSQGTGGAAYFSNLRVVQVTSPVITSVTLTTKTNVAINFMSFDGDDTAASFAVQTNKLVNGVYADMNPVTISQLGSNGVFQATLTTTNNPMFYRIRHK